MPPQYSLRDLQEEARALEFDLDLSSCRIDLSQRSDPDNYFISGGPPNDRQAIQQAWHWLQMQRAWMYQADIERTDPTARRIAQKRTIRLYILTMLYLTANLFAPAFAIGVGALFLSNEVWIGYSAMAAMLGIQSLRIFKRYRRNS